VSLLLVGPCRGGFSIKHKKAQLLVVRKTATTLGS